MPHKGITVHNGLKNKGKYAVISGGAKGIGEAILVNFWKGCNVAILDKDKDALNQLKDRNSDPGKFILPIEVDLTEIDNCQSAIKEYWNGQVDNCMFYSTMLESMMVLKLNLDQIPLKITPLKPPTCLRTGSLCSRHSKETKEQF